jgi:cytoskeletal protein RodZ
MQDSVGKKLSKARLKKGLSIDEAAHATRLRPDKIVALENDDYSTFASNVYARGFLQIYGRYLNVDVQEFASTLEGINSISIEDYQYLNSGAPPRQEERSSYTPQAEKRGPSMIGMLMFVILLGALGFGFHLYVNWQRITGEPVAHLVPGSSPAPMVKSNPVAPAPAPSVPAHAVAPTVPTAAMNVAPAATPAVAAAVPAATPGLRAAVQPPGVSDRDFVAPPALAPAMTSGAINEVLVQPIRKTWIIVRKDDPKSAPIFEDYVYPDSPALKLKGMKFFIEARDPSAIQIRKNGAPMAYQPSGVEVQ